MSSISEAELQAAIVKFLTQRALEHNQVEEAKQAEGQQQEADQEEKKPMEERPSSVQDLCKQAGDAGVAVIKRLAPFGLQLVASAAAYSAGLGLFQLIGMGLRVSCNHRILSSCLGCMGVGVSSAFAGQVSRHVQRQLEDRKGPLEALRTPLWAHWQAEDALLDALVGVGCFKLWRGQFRQVMPSDLRQQGAFGYSSVPVAGPADQSAGRYAAGPQRSQLVAIFKRDGCHHCGSRVGKVIGDHIPPSKLFHEMRLAAKAAKGQPEQPLQQIVTKVKEVLSIKDAPLRQVYYAQCESCCAKQANLLRHGKRLPLVMHRWLVPPGVAPGVVAAFRHFTLRDLTRGPGDDSSSGPKGRGRNGRKEAAQANNSSNSGGGWFRRGSRQAMEMEMAASTAAASPLSIMASPALAVAKGPLVVVEGEGEEEGGTDVGAHAGGDDVPRRSATAAALGGASGGLWAWAQRMEEEVPGTDVYRSLAASLSISIDVAAGQLAAVLGGPAGAASHGHSRGASPLLGSSSQPNHGLQLLLPSVAEQEAAHASAAGSPSQQEGLTFSAYSPVQALSWSQRRQHHQLPSPDQAATPAHGSPEQVRPLVLPLVQQQHASPATGTLGGASQLAPVFGLPAFS